MQDYDAVEADLALVEAEERYVLSSIAGLDGSSNSLNGRDSFLRDPETLEQLNQLAFSKQPIGNMNLGQAMSRDELLASFEQRRNMMAAAGDVTIPDTARISMPYGISPQLRRQTRLPDLIPTGPMEGKSFTYTVETGTFAGAAETPESTTKPTGTVVLTDSEVIARTIAVWTKAGRESLADVPSLQQTINRRLLYGVERRLEDQVIAGSGDGENLLGIVNSTGIVRSRERRRRRL
jgi:HK97 family phage major capsid protein